MSKFTARRDWEEGLEATRGQEKYILFVSSTMAESLADSIRDNGWEMTVGSKGLAKPSPVFIAIDEWHMERSPTFIQILTVKA